VIQTGGFKARNQVGYRASLNQVNRFKMLIWINMKTDFEEDNRSEKGSNPSNRSIRKIRRRGLEQSNKENKQL
jgi:hypothetical protein